MHNYFSEISIESVKDYSIFQIQTHSYVQYLFFIMKLWTVITLSSIGGSWFAVYNSLWSRNDLLAMTFLLTVNAVSWTREKLHNLFIFNTILFWMLLTISKAFALKYKKRSRKYCMAIWNYSFEIHLARSIDTGWNISYRHHSCSIERQDWRRSW